MRRVFLAVREFTCSHLDKGSAQASGSYMGNFKQWGQHDDPETQTQSGHLYIAFVSWPLREVGNRRRHLHFKLLS